MSDYRFGDDYRLNIYPKDAMDCWGEIDMDKVEAVEIDWVDFVRKPDDKSRWFELFGTPERAARTIGHVCQFTHGGEMCERCRLYVFNECDGALRLMSEQTIYDALLEWLRGDAE